MKWFYYKLLYKRKTILLLDVIISTLILKISKNLYNKVIILHN